MINEKIKYLIIGNSAGGIGAVEAIRERDKTGTITIVSDEPYPAYSRPLISGYLAEHYPLERMLFRPADFYDNKRVRAILGKKASQLDPKSHTLELDSGEVLAWEKVLLATGGKPIVPPLEGIDLQGVFRFTRLDDARAIDEFLNQYSQRKVKAVVIGGGLIGISVTEALVKRGVEVSIVEMKDRVLNVILDEEASAFETEILKRSGVKIITGCTVNKINSYLPGFTTSAALSDGRSLPCDMVIVAIGVQPRLELAAGAGLKTNRGIIVDRHMASSTPDVYACGDVAEAHDFVYGENRLTPIWPNAYIGGRVAGFNMAGVATEYQGGTAMNAMKYFGVNILSAGIVSPPDDSYEVITEKHDDIYRKVVLKDGRLAGMVFSGDIEKAGIAYNLMKDGVNVDDFKRALVADNFGLISLPEEIWKPKLTIPHSVSASRVISIEQPEEVLAGE